MTNNWNGIDLLDIVESYAHDNGMIASESELSELFDSRIAPFVIAEYGESDSIAMNEVFNDWADMLCEDGTIHPEQYDNYCYVVKWSR